MKTTYTLILIFAIFLIMSQVSKSEDTLLAKASMSASPVAKLFGAAKALSCSVESVNVCVLTQSDEDCLKLGGHKVKSCSQTIEPARTADHHECSKGGEDSKEPVSCYGF